MVGIEQATAPQLGKPPNAEWRQGDILSLPSACFTSYTTAAQPDGELPLQHRPLKLKEKLVIASQDCDIVSADEPNVEAMLLRVKDKPSDRAYLSRAGRNSARLFVLDFERGYVADARHRMFVEKPSLANAERAPWVVDEVTRGEFALWLARRYERPAIPDDIHDALMRPISEEIDRLAQEEPATLAALDRAVRAVRVQLPSRPGPPYALRLVLVLADGGLSSAEAAAVQSFVRTIQERVALSTVPCTLEVDSYAEGELLHNVVRATVLVNLDYVTKGGIELLQTRSRGAA